MSPPGRPKGEHRRAQPEGTPGSDLPVLTLPGPRPLVPRISAHTESFWTRLAGGAFGVAHCECCGHLTFPPKAHCPACGAAGLGWMPVDGQGTVYSATTVHAAPALFAAAAPYVLVVLDLREQVRLVTRWIGPQPACGAAAQLVLLQHDDGVLFGATST